jgi:hypothetical protein
LVVDNTSIQNNENTGNYNEISCITEEVELGRQPESRLDNGVFSNDLSHTGIGHVLENIDQVLKIHSFLSL